MSQLVHKYTLISDVVHKDKNGIQSLIFTFKLNFPLCENFLEININFFDDEYIDGYKTAKYGEDFLIINTPGMVVTTTEQGYLSNVRFLIDNITSQFSFEAFLTNDDLEENKIIKGEFIENEAYYALPTEISGIFNKSDMKKLNFFNIQYEAENKDYTLVYFNPNPPTVEFAESSITLDEEDLSNLGALSEREINITRTGDLSLNSMVRLDIINTNAGYEEDFVIDKRQKYFQFTANENQIKILFTSIIDLIDPENTEQIIFELSSTDNAIIGSNNQFTINIENAPVI